MRYCSLLTLLFACAEPIDVPENGTVGEQAPAIEGGNGTQAAPPSDGTAGFGDVNLGAAPPTMGTFAGDLPDTEVKPKFTQEELADAATIKGVVNCTGCTGSILIRVLPPPPMEPEVTTAVDGMQLIAQTVISEPGEYAVKVPDKSPYVLQVVDDINKDGLPSQGERMGMREDGPVFVDGVLENVDITVGVFPDKEPVTGMGAIPSPPSPGEEGVQVAPGEGPPTGAEGLPVEGGMIPEGMDGSEAMGEGTPPQNPEEATPPPTVPEAEGDSTEGAGPPADE